MEYEEIKVSRAVIRDEIFSVLKAMSFRSFTRRPSFPIPNPQTMYGRGRELAAFLDEIYKNLENSGKLQKERFTVTNSTAVWTMNTYFKTYIQGMIFEEVMALVRQGILMLAKIEYHPTQWNGTFTFNSNHLMVTEYGEKVLEDFEAMPYFAEDYIRLLSKTAEPDDELKVYLSEGLACLHNNLPRAAILLLRLSSEHLLQKLIDVILVKLPNEAFKRELNKLKSGSLERKGNVIFDHLESSLGKDYLKKMVGNELKPTFHSLRTLAGAAAHKNIPIEQEQVRFFYNMYASTIYRVSMEVIRFLSEE